MKTGFVRSKFYDSETGINRADIHNRKGINNAPTLLTHSLPYKQQTTR